MTYIDVVLGRYRQRGLLLDTNLTVLLIVGSRRPDLVGIQGFKRISSYVLRDLQLLLFFKGLFRTFVATPHILAEVSNFISQLASPAREECLIALREYVAGIDELYVPSDDASSRPEFLQLGLTDCTLAEKAGDFLVLSADARCVARLHQASMDALNFDMLRAQVRFS